jgi:hypothetical protein
MRRDKSAGKGLMWMMMRAESLFSASVRPYENTLSCYRLLLLACYCPCVNRCRQTLAPPGSQQEARERRVPGLVTSMPSGRTKSVASPIVAFAPKTAGTRPRGDILQTAAAAWDPVFGFRCPRVATIFVHRAPAP